VNKNIANPIAVTMLLLALMPVMCRFINIRNIFISTNLQLGKHRHWSLISVMLIVILSLSILISAVPFEAQAAYPEISLAPYLPTYAKLMPNQLSYNVTEATANLTVYVVPAITDTKILPKSSISSSYISNTISARVSPGEYNAVSFVVNSDEDIDSLQVVASDLSGNGNKLLNSTLDIKTVKCWYQGGYEASNERSVVGRFLTPELLLKDDSLVIVKGDDWTKWNVSNPTGKNYLKLTNRTYIHISDDTQVDDSPNIIPASERPVQDASTLQPVHLPANYNKQFWITLHAPEGAVPDNYKGTISLKSGSQILKTLDVNLQVLPIDLPQPNVEYSVIYDGTISGLTSISSFDKSVEQYTAEQNDMREHGIINPTIAALAPDDILLQELSIRQQTGMDNTNVYYFTINANADIVSHFKALTAPYGVVNLYQYGPDEQDINNSTNRDNIKDIHNAGGKYFVGEWIYSYADSVADVVDLLNAGDLWPEMADKYHSYGHKIYSYNNPQVVPDAPELFRRNYGLALWQADYDGTMDYAYQNSMGDIWNDFDCNQFRDHVFAYPTMNGVVDTTKWEGFREGVNDMRYLAALQNEIAAAKSRGENTTVTEAENYLAQLKSCNLEDQDLDAIRSQMIDHILMLSSSS